MSQQCCRKGREVLELLGITAPSTSPRAPGEPGKCSQAGRLWWRLPGLVILVKDGKIPEGYKGAPGFAGEGAHHPDF